MTAKEPGAGLGRVPEGAVRGGACRGDVVGEGAGRRGVGGSETLEGEVARGIGVSWPDQVQWWAWSGAAVAC